MHLFLKLLRSGQKLPQRRNNHPQAAAKLWIARQLIQITGDFFKILEGRSRGIHRLLQHEQTLGTLNRPRDVPQIGRRLGRIFRQRIQILQQVATA